MVRLQRDSIAQEVMDINIAKAGYTALYVDGTNGLDTYPGDSWEQPFKTIQHALNEAGSWCKIFIKSGTYAENLTITGKIGIHLIGECRSNVIISGSIAPIIVYGARCIIEECWVKGYGEFEIKFVGAYNAVKNCIIERASGLSGAGVLAGGNYSVVDNIVLSSCVAGGTSRGIQTNAEHCEFKNCHISASNLTQGIYTAGSDYCKIHDNTIENTTTGIVIAAASDHNTIFHNNLLSNTTQVSDAGTGNNWFENFYDDHTTDSDHDGMADTEYSFTTGKDYQPVSRRNGWKQESLPTIGGAGDATVANQTTIITDTEKIYDVALGTSPTDGALASFIATGGTALGSRLPASKSLYDVIALDRLDHATYGLSALDTDLGTIIANQTVGIKKGVERTIVFKMVDATDFATPEPSITVTEERSLDGGAFAACTNAASEIGGAGNGAGWYKITLTATEMNANEIVFKGTGAGCAQCDRLIVTES